LGVGGGLIWFVRFFGKLALRREAMGFGDVTLMAMLGAFLGWQPALLIFFLAPFAGLIVGVVKFLVRRSNEIPYGPFLCLGAAYVVVCWPACWERVHSAFGIGWLVPAVMVVGLVILILLLLLLGVVKRLLGRGA
jgi:leader peptidase (prepilin peptidase)/N-methyltransferase